MRAALALCGFAIAAGLGACGESSAAREEQTRRAARLERELRQAKAAESLALPAPLESRPLDFEEALARVKASEELAKLEKDMDQLSGRRREEIEARHQTLRRLLKTLEGDDSGKTE